MNLHVKVSSNRVEVAWHFICYIKYLSVAEIVTCIQEKMIIVSYCILLKTNENIFLVITSGYSFQIAPEVIWLPIQTADYGPGGDLKKTLVFKL